MYFICLLIEANPRKVQAAVGFYDTEVPHAMLPHAESTTMLRECHSRKVCVCRRLVARQFDR
jgi:hypothetical protein